MKIAIIVSNFPPKWLAGTEIATYHMAEHLAQHGHEVHVITSLDEGLPEESCEKGFHTHRLPRVRIRFVGVFAFWVNIIRTLRKINPGIVHAQGLGSGMPALLSNRLMKNPYVIYGRGSDVYLPDWFNKLTAKGILKNASAVIALTEHMKDSMQAIYSRDVVVVPNGIDLNENAEREAERGDPGKRVLFVGRLHPVKGVRHLLQAMSIVHQDLPEAKLILVGDGDEREHLETLTDSLGIRECVEFVGKVPHERVQDYMNQVEAFVLPSLSEGFPVTILEAMACGLPVVATRVGGIPDIIEDGTNGYLVDAMNQERMAEALLKVLRNEPLRKDISNNNREKAEKYRWEAVAAELEEIYRNSL
ncbi:MULTISPECIES: glycosyltransferase family 4 protein [Methanoculleus]|uniref:Glycosyl transferase, group 1 n=2 Tax=Methanoculleus TaxID=45989 RepID=A3CTC6_METMJ|nr:MULTISPECIES: glycosyltransferase family 4 protein [Methanoculleus]ABN56626.1 glycosyl transferase, group 1 [Methanoculleus marisnigri JR1]MCC7555651.1 glycosyltransferase family 4 protein [Methanoculleus marisnigri]UYU18065.1 glycosyltransferase family 4 protein [Methanoculleus submarinus]